MEEKDALLQELDSCKEKMRGLNLKQDVVLNVSSVGCDRSHAHSEDLEVSGQGMLSLLCHHAQLIL